jgi:cob(I)alamin adenosyltransferase
MYKERRSVTMSIKGLIHVYYGNGKGKTTAALGLALRAAGCDKKVIFVQFLKDWDCGEHNSLAVLSNVTVLRGKPAGGKFVRDMTGEEKQKTKESLDSVLQNALQSVMNAKCDLLVLDEAIDAQNLGVLDEQMLEELIYNKPNSLELILTGHKPDDKLLKYADYVTEMVKRKHPYDEGIQARRGIEF